MSSRWRDAWIAGLLTLLFVGLKVTGWIDWSWLWVLAPAWIYAVLCIIVAIIVVCADRSNTYEDSDG